MGKALKKVVEKNKDSLKLVDNLETQVDTNFNRNTYDRIWHELSDFIKYNPGSRHRRRIINNMLRGIEFDSVLDVGCGNGELLLELEHQFGSNKDLNGADLSAQVVRDNGQKFPKMKFNALDIQRNALQQTYDLLVCSEVIEHLEDRSLAFKNLSKMMNEHGYLLITCPTGKVFATEKHYGHVSHPKMMEIYQHAYDNDLEVVKMMNWGWPFYRMLKEVTNINPEWSLKNYGETTFSAFNKFICNFLYYVNFLNIPSSIFGCQFFILLRKKSKSKDSKTADAFATSWNNLDAGSVYTRKQYLDWIAPLSALDLKNKSVLEMGCGNGSLLMHTQAMKPKRLLGIDLGDSVKSARQNLETTDSKVWEIKQSDLVGFEGEKFDIVYCIGVLHHLKDPHEGFRSVVKNTNSGGRFHCWVYAHEGNWPVIYLVEPLRKICSTLPWWLTKYGAALPLAMPLFFYANFLKFFKASGIFSWMPLYEYCLWIAEREFKFFRHVVFDQLVTPQTAYISESEIQSWMAENKDIDSASTYIIMRNGNSWKFGGTKK